MPYGLVLEGGGAKGSYQLGSYMAVQEKNYDIRLVVGTSMGALNGAFIVQQNTDVLARIWQETPFVVPREIVDVLEGQKAICAKTLAKGARGLIRTDIRPLKEMIHRHIDEEKIRASDIDYGLVVYSLTEGKTKFLYLEDIPKGELKQYILASCCYPIFAPIKIGGDYYVDGGIGNNLPYEMVLAKGLDPIILRTNPLKEGEDFPQNALVIGPERAVANTMHFDSDLSFERMQLGYRHAKRILGNYDGIDYIFEPISERYALRQLEALFFESAEDFRYLIEKKGSLERGIVESLWHKLAKALDLKEDYSYKQLLIGLLEARAGQLHFDSDAIYSVDGMLEMFYDAQDIHPRVETMLERVLYLLFCKKRLAIE